MHVLGHIHQHTEGILLAKFGDGVVQIPIGKNSKVVALCITKQWISNACEYMNHLYKLDWCPSTGQVWQVFDNLVRHLLLEIMFVLYGSFPRLTTGLGGCMYYWQHLAVITIFLVRILSSHRWSPWAFQRNKHHPWIVATQNKQWKK